MRHEIGRDDAVLGGVVVQAWSGLDLVGCTTAAEHRACVLAGLGAWLTEHGYVRPEFTDALLAREAEFPTGLQTPDGGVALAHTGATMVVRPALVVCWPERQIPFRRMDQPDTEIGVRMVILLALTSGSEHLEALRRIASLLSDERLRPSLLAPSTSPTDALQAISSALDDAPSSTT